VSNKYLVRYNLLVEDLLSLLSFEARVSASALTFLGCSVLGTVLFSFTDSVDLVSVLSTAVTFFAAALSSLLTTSPGSEPESTATPYMSI